MTQKVKTRTWQIVLSIIGIALAAIVGETILKTDSEVHGLGCAANVENIVQCLHIYLADNDYRFPPAANWDGVLQKYLRDNDPFTCPKARKGGGYGYNRALDSLSYFQIRDPANTVLIFESDSRNNISGGAELLPDIPRHNGTDWYGFADNHYKHVPRKIASRTWWGHTTWLKQPDDDNITWQP